jgi:molybdopterin synthase catalytic subunit
VFRISRAPIDAEAVRRSVEGPGNGAVVVFHGTVRERTGGRRVTRLEYEAYEPMALRQMEAIGADVIRRHGASALSCWHRVGTLAISESAMVLAVSAPHRKAALEAVEEFVARLKQDVPIWKKEHFEDGAVWVGTPEDPQGERAATGRRA